MTILALGVPVAAVLVAVTAAVTAWLVSRPRAIERRLRQRMVVTLKSGASFDGLLVEADARAWVLRDANAHQADDRGENVPVDGELILLVADIQYAQKP